MTSSQKTSTETNDYTCKVAILGAGPVGLTIANYLGQAGVEVLVIEKLDQLIDYPRAIGIDDEALRTIQSVGLIDEVLPHTTPYHAMRFLTPKGRCFADIQPMTDEFGWSRRNAFIQPQVDAVLYRGLSRFNNVKVLFSRDVDRKSTRLNSSHVRISYAVFCLKKKTHPKRTRSAKPAWCSSSQVRTRPVRACPPTSLRPPRWPAFARSRTSMRRYCSRLTPRNS